MIYQKWLELGLDSTNKSLYRQKDINQSKYIPMPPPNITGKLHMGHSLFLTIQDSLTRFWKNSGYDTLWLPGLDHAGIATNDKILEKQSKENITYEQASLSIERDHKDIILNQIKKMGALPNWKTLNYTLDYNDFIEKIINLMHRQKRIFKKEDDWILDFKDYSIKLLKDLESKEIKIMPEKELKNLKPFLKDYENWKITRDIKWGTKFPLDNSLTLDTWFNSSLWPLACLLKDKDMIDKYYPADILETGSDILFFWCARMLMMSHYLYDNQKELGLNLKSKYCFYNIYLHGIIRDEKGLKFSKSLGNGIDPLDLMKEYSTDAIRLFLITRTGPAEDIIFDTKQLLGFEKFTNKIYQAARFFSINSFKNNINKLDLHYDIEIEEELLSIRREYDNLMNNFKFLEASRLIQSKFKEYFCDIFIENNKRKIWDGDRDFLIKAICHMDYMLAMIEPFCPFLCFYIKEQFFSIKND